MPWFQMVVVLMDLFERRAVSGKLLARAEIPGSEGLDLKPVLNWTNVCSPEHTSDTSTNYDSFLN